MSVFFTRRQPSSRRRRPYKSPSPTRAVPKIASEAARDGCTPTQRPLLKPIRGSVISRGGGTCWIGAPDRAEA